MSVYLDNAATTPVAASVRDAMAPYQDNGFGNPSSLHSWGRRARAAVEEAREQIAAALDVAPLEVMFTGGGTEADNAAIKGIAWAARDAGRGTHLVTTNIEHHAVRDTMRWLAEYQGFSLDVVPVETDGVVDVDRLLDAVRHDTVLVSVMTANNEIGTLQPLDRIGPALAERDVPLHTDAVQAFGRAPLQLNDWGIGAAAFSAHKLSGPKGVGAWVQRRGLAAQPLLHGGGQERDLRSGTLNTAGIVGFGAAAALAMRTLDEEAARLRRLRDRLLDAMLGVGGVTLNGSLERRLPNNINVGVEGCDGEALLLALDREGVAASSGSACQSGATEPSYVLAAIAAPQDRGHIRFTLGRDTTQGDVDTAAEVFAHTVKRLRDAGGAFL